MSSNLKNKDFKNKETAFLLCKNPHGNDLSITEVPVVSVGPKYVTVDDNGWKLKFYEIGEPYLIMENDWRKSRLFLTKQDAEEYWERKDLEKKLVQNYYKSIYSMPLAKLRLIQAIMEDTGKEDVPEITGVMTVSTKHIYSNTAAFLDMLSENNGKYGLSCRKDHCGWTVKLPDLFLQDTDTDEKVTIPEDLQSLIKKALNSGCKQLVVNYCWITDQP